MHKENERSILRRTAAEVLLLGRRYELRSGADTCAGRHVPILSTGGAVKTYWDVNRPTNEYISSSL